MPTDTCKPTRGTWVRFNAALIALVVLAGATGCFGYTRADKRGAYVVDSVLIAGGGGIVAADVFLSEDECTGPNCVEAATPISGVMVAGSMLLIGGIVGIIVNATRPIVKTSR